MSKTTLIIQREFMTRVKKRSFLIMTILGPLLFAALIIAPALIANMDDGAKTVLVVDEPALLLGEDGSDQYAFTNLNPAQFNLETAKEFFQKSEFDALLYIRSGETGDVTWIKDHTAIYGKGDISMNMQRYIESLMEEKIQEEKMLLEGIDPEIVAQSRVTVNLLTYSIDEEGEKASATPVKMIVGYMAGFMIYFFIFFYTSQVMRGVIEEKTNRIIEVIISSVKPFQLMLGKVIGIGAVGLLQFLIWVVLSGVIYAVAGATILKDKFDTEALASGQQGMDQAMEMGKGMEIMQMLETINLPVVLGGFLFFFIGGYLLYAALFAAVGSAVDNETDSQQFMLPVTIPLILGIVVMAQVIESPNGPIAFWFSMFPLTSPIVMMARLPFLQTDQLWQLALSGALLVAGFIAATYLAGRIYRVGILMYGKKPSWKELYKWMTYRNS
jgi:ABC-2 type transport system permease protein